AQECDRLGLGRARARRAAALHLSEPRLRARGLLARALGRHAVADHAAPGAGDRLPRLRGARAGHGAERRGSVRRERRASRCARGRAAQARAAQADRLCPHDGGSLMLNARDRLIVALDLSSVEEAEALIGKLGEAVTFYKIGYQLGFAGGLALAE